MAWGLAQPVFQIFIWAPWTSAAVKGELSPLLIWDRLPHTRT